MTVKLPTIEGIRLNQCKVVKHLGVVMNYKITWHDHVRYSTNKALKSLWAYKRALEEKSQK